MRPGIADALEDLKENHLVLLIAPTGYGKTRSFHYLYGELRRFWRRITHVLPLRALIYDVLESACNMGISPSDISYQAMIDSIVIESSRGIFRIVKDPYLSGRYNVVTYDSYLWTMFVAPLAEIDYEYAHYDVGLLMASTGLIAFDEVHLIAGTEELVGEAGNEYAKLVAATCLVPRFITYSGGRIIMMTATMPSSLINMIIKESGVNKVSIHICGGGRAVNYYCSSIGRNIIVHDITSDYKDVALKYASNVETYLSDSRLEDDVKNVIEERGSSHILVVCNTVRRAVKTYDILRSKIGGKVDRIILIHSRIIEGDKAERIDNIKRSIKAGERIIVVATQIIEAGVDLSFDALITEIAPPASLIQRIGRVSRDFDNPHEAYIVINVSGESIESATKVYPNKIISKTIESLKTMLSHGSKFMDWRYGILKPSYIDLIRIYDKMIREYDISYFKGLLRELIISYRNPLLSKSTEEIIALIDRAMKGSIVRESILIPLYIEDYGGCITVSSRFLEERYSQILELSNGCALALYDDGSIIAENINKLLRSPCKTLIKMYRVRGKRFLGLKCRRGVYDRVRGLV